MGLAYYRKKDYTKALEQYERSLLIKTNIQEKDSIDVAITLNNIGLVYYSKK